MEVHGLPLLGPGYFYPSICIRFSRQNGFHYKKTSSCHLLAWMADIFTERLGTSCSSLLSVYRIANFALCRMWNSLWTTFLIITALGCNHIYIYLATSFHSFRWDLLLNGPAKDSAVSLIEMRRDFFTMNRQVYINGLQMFLSHEFIQSIVFIYRF